MTREIIRPMLASSLRQAVKSYSKEKKQKNSKSRIQQLFVAYLDETIIER